VLRRFLLGLVSEDEADPIESHVAHCEHCLRLVPTVAAEDGYVAAMRDQAATGPEPPDATVAAVIERLSSLPPDALLLADRGSADTPAPAGLGPDGPFAGLAPPQADGEIGRLGGYRVLRRLGAGGMGVVFLAEDEQLQRRVALKAMRPGLAGDPAARQRFLREARATAALQHDHVVRIYQVGEEGGVPFLAMELLEGEPLEARLQREGKLPYPELLRVGREVAAGLAAAHERGLIHRDVKPANVWLEAGGGRVKLLDFGLVRQLRAEGTLTREGTVLGTPGYLAPEQLRGRPVDARGDLFSLGCLLYRASTGEPPFRGDDVLVTLMAVTSTHPPAPRVRNPQLPAAFSALVMRLLAKDPRHRPASAAAVAAALQALAGGPAARPGPGRAAWLAAVAAACVAVVAAAVGYGPWRSPPERAAPPPTGPAEVAAAPGEVRRLVGHTAGVERAAFLPGGDRAVTGAHDGTVRIWDLNTGLMKAAPLRHPGEVYCLAVSADGHRLLTGGSGEGGQGGLAGCTIRLWDLDTGKELRAFEWHTDVVSAVAFLPGDRKFLSSAWDGTIRLWDAEGQEEPRLFERPGATVRCLAVSPDGSRAASGNADGDVRLWDVFTGKVFKRLPTDAEEVDCVAFTPDSKRLLTGSTDRLVRVWDVEHGTVTATFRGHTDRPRSVAVSPDGRRALSGGPEAAVRLWEVETGRKVVSFAGHAAGVRCVTFSPDGRRALSASGDLTVRLWQLP
jgi:hypothetical protein